MILPPYQVYSYKILSLNNVLVVIRVIVALDLFSDVLFEFLDLAHISIPTGEGKNYWYLLAKFLAFASWSAIINY
jgi:hypothetical protein